MRNPSTLFSMRLAQSASAIILAASLCSCTSLHTGPVQVRYWSATPLSRVAFPEQDPEGPVWKDLAGKDDLGLCFSGGGTRSASATAGYLRALKEMGVLEKVRYVSGVSGGSWAATPWVFSPPGDDTTLLEDYVGPSGLTRSNTKPGAGSITEAVANAYVFWYRGVFPRLLSFQGSESYSRSIAVRFLEPFGLGDPNRWFTWSEETGADILRRNPALARKNQPAFYSVPKGRPYLIAGGTLRHYDAVNWESEPGKRIPIEYTPLYSGSRGYYHPSRHAKEPIGGGYVESFAYDSIKPVRIDSGLAEAHLYIRGPFWNSPVFSLADVIGSSGAAPGEFGAAVELLGFPKFSHWSPHALQHFREPAAGRYAQQDGGHSENLGIMPLLARRVGTIFAFVNAPEAVVAGCDSFRFPNYVEALFGLPGVNRYDKTQVFHARELANLARQLETSVKNGGPAVASTTLEVLANERFGVEPYTVKVVWCFLEVHSPESGKSASGNWIGKIGDPAVKDLFGKGMLKNFPLYGTFAENKGFQLWDIIRLKPEQTTLLAHYTAWSLMSRADLLNAPAGDGPAAAE